MCIRDRPTPCDCDETVAGRKTVSLTAGPLLVGNAAVLGSVGNVLVLAKMCIRDSSYVASYITSWDSSDYKSRCV